MELEFKFTKEEAQKILNALLKEPYAVIFDIVDKFQKQAAEQIKKESK